MSMPMHLAEAPKVLLEEEDLVSPHIATQSVGLDDEAYSEGEAVFVPRPAPKYVQGVVQGRQAYLVTNILEAASRSLIQPQMVWTMGRNREAGMPIHDRMMSRRHAVLLFDPEENAFFFVDLNSMNGSYLNGVRLNTNRERLKDGDFLRVGNTEFFFFLSQEMRTLESMHPEVKSRLSNPVKQAYDEFQHEPLFRMPKK
jgi:hypothetical protein